jgi:N-acetylglucosamine malate deacetylase 1
VDAPTLLVVLAHPDDEVVTAGAILAQKAAGSRVVVLWLTRGEMTQAFGDLPPDEVARRRMALGETAAEILGVEARFLELPDTGLRPTREMAVEVARVIAEVRPDGLLTWGEAWTRGFRHPDHQATAQIARDALAFARIAKAVAPTEPHRSFVPIFTLRDRHSTLPAVGLDVGPYVETILEVGAHYKRALGFGDRTWIEGRLQRVGQRWGLKYAEEYDVWETEGGAVETLLPPVIGELLHHPDRGRIPGISDTDSE